MEGMNEGGEGGGGKMVNATVPHMPKSFLLYPFQMYQCVHMPSYSSDAT